MRAASKCAARLAWIVAFGLTVLPALGASPRCQATDGDEAQIVACSRIIDDPAVPRAARAIALFNRGLTHKWKDALQEALADFDTLIAREKPIGLIFANRGLVFQRMGDFARSSRARRCLSHEGRSRAGHRRFQGGDPDLAERLP